MANTVSLLSYANTFGDWVVSTNALARENNDFAANNYTKPVGTLYLNDPALGLQVANNAVIAGQLQVQGIGSSAYIQNNLRVDTQAYFTNTIIGLTNSGELISNGKITASGSGTGLSVSNNATIGGTLNVTKATTLSNTLSVTGATTLNNTLIVNSNATFSSNIISNGYINSSYDVNAANFNAVNTIKASTLNILGSGVIAGDLSVQSQLSVGGNFIINGATVYNTNTFTLNANSIVGLNSSFNVNRGTSGANAAIRWNEANDNFDILDVNNATYYRILTNQNLSDSLTTANSTIIATSAAASALNDKINAANTFLQANTGSTLAASKAYTDTANTSMKSYVDTANTFLQANTGSALAVAKTYTDTANTSLKSYSDNLFTINNGVNTTQNTNITATNTYAVSGYAQANAANTLATSGYAQANAATLSAQAAFNTANNRVSSVSGTTGRISSTGGLTPILDLVTTGPGVTSVTYASVSIDAYGRVTALSSGTTPVTSITGTSNQIVVTGTTTPTLSLPQSIATSSSVQFASLGIGTGASGVAGEIRATGDISGYYSDDRLKTKFGNIENALAKVNTLNGFHYSANEVAQALGYRVKPEVGLSAQEVQAVLPEIVSPAPIDENYLTINYEKMVPLLVEAIKELTKEIEILKSK